MVNGLFDRDKPNRFRLRPTFPPSRRSTSRRIRYGLTAGETENVVGEVKTLTYAFDGRHPK